MEDDETSLLRSRVLRSVLLVIGALSVRGLFITPALLKDDVIAALEAAAASQLRADVSFGDVEVNLLSTFPQLSARISSVTITNQAPFADHILIAAEQVDLRLQLLEALHGRYIIDVINLDQAEASLHINADGAASWDIFLPGDPNAAAAPLSVSLNALTVHNGRVRYLDEGASLQADLRGVAMNGRLAVRGNQVALSGTLTADEADVDSEGIRYLNGANLRGEANLDVDLEQGLYTWRDNQLLINALPLQFSGTMQFIEEAIDFNMNIVSPATDFRYLLSMVPAVYQHDFADVRASGQFSLEGSVNGRMQGESLPGFALSLAVSDGGFQSPSLPGAVSAIQLSAALSPEGGPDLDNTRVPLSKFAGSLDGPPFHARRQTPTPLTHPQTPATARAESR